MVKKKDDMIFDNEQIINDAALLETNSINPAAADSDDILAENILPLDDLQTLSNNDEISAISPLSETLSVVKPSEEDMPLSAETHSSEILFSDDIAPEQHTQISEINDPSDKQTTDLNPSTPSSRRTNAQQIMAIDEEAKVRSAEDSENQLWMTLRNAQRSHRILSSTLSGIERLENNLPLAIVYYQGMRIAIPATEMALSVRPQDFSTEAELYNRYTQLLSRMLAAEIDFVIAGLDRRHGAVLGSRWQAMQRKQQRYYRTLDAQGKALISEGQIAEARVISVSEKLLRVEVFGVETNVAARDIAWEWVDDAHNFYQVGDRVPVKVQSIQQDEEQLTISVSIKDAINNPTADNLQKCSIGGKYIGTVTGIENVIYVRLDIGVNAIATTVRDQRTVCRKDEVSFVITRIDSEAGLAVGIITRIIKQAN